MADDRRIIFSSYVVPLESGDPEEAIGDKWSISWADVASTPVKKTFGGKNTVTDLHAVQWGESWVSFRNIDWTWDDGTGIAGENWANVYQAWDGVTSVGTDAVQLAPSVTNDLSFAYIKNTGKIDLTVSINGESGNYYILVPANGSTHFRGSVTADSDFDCEDVYMKTASGTTSVEYIIAKK